MIGAMQTGLSGILRGIDRFDAAAADAVRATLPLADDARRPEHDLVGSLVEMMLSKRQIEVSSRVVDSANQVEQSLLDILA